VWLLSYKELNKLGLRLTVQQGYTLSDWEISCNQKILARIKGTNTEKALLLLSHYDSAPLLL
jgi:acetylornithine deacetylase/succinyl-diaminopimelate desuccinylase-like protein